MSKLQRAELELRAPDGMGPGLRPARVAFRLGVLELFLSFRL